MPERTTKFQRLTALLHSCLAGKARVTESALVRDRITGEEREVDVYIEAEASGYATTIAIEVIETGRKADVTWVERMHARHARLPTDKLVLVSERGFSKPALQKAALLGVEAVTIEEALASDWQLVAKLTETGFFELTTFKYGCAIIYDSPDEGGLNKEKSTCSQRSLVHREESQRLIKWFAMQWISHTVATMRTRRGVHARHIRLGSCRRRTGRRTTPTRACSTRALNG
jgi:hypothetical protein